MPQSAPSLFTVLAQPSDYTVVALLFQEADRRRQLALSLHPPDSAVAAGELCEIELDLCTRLIQFYETSVAHDEALCKKYYDLTRRAFQVLEVADAAGLKQAQGFVRQHLVAIFESIFDFLDNRTQSSLCAAALDNDQSLLTKHAKSTAAYAKLSARHLDPQNDRKVSGIWQSLDTDAEAEEELKKNSDATPALRRTRSGTANGRMDIPPSQDAPQSQNVLPPPQNVLHSQKINISALWVSIADLKERAVKASGHLAQCDLNFQEKLRRVQLKSHRDLAAYGSKLADKLRQIRRSTMLVAFQKGIDMPELSYHGSSTASTACATLLDKSSIALEPPVTLPSLKRSREDRELADKPSKKRK
ncbi:hypothetical protein GGG16DRAFT_109899 [Schizophyllum commune]